MSPKASLLLYSSFAMLIAILVLSGQTTSVMGQHFGGKRFDCRLFCKMTGYHGMIGGCRCSFTLFTAKRAQPFGSKRPAGWFDPSDSSISRNKVLPSPVTSYYRIKLPIPNKTKRLFNEADEWNAAPPPTYFSSLYAADHPHVER